MKFLHKFLFVLLCLSTTYHTYAQLNVATGSTAEEMVATILGDGVNISNATINCPGESAGTFDNGNTTNIGTDAGILLTSGSVFNAVGPNTSDSSSANNNAPGDEDLDILSNNTTNDACVLEFDFIPTGTSISFNYVFASEEYQEYFCTEFNDIFAFLISGPNPGGGTYNNENIAIIPGSSLPVAINNIGPGTCGGVNNANLYIDNFGGATIEYDGFTTVLTAYAALVPCQEYHMKLVIADNFDRVFDSGVFIEEGSFVSNSLAISGNVTNPSCPLSTDGSVNISVSGGIPPYTFLWSNGATTEDVSGLGTGTYSVQVTDNVGCVETASFELEVISLPFELSCEDIVVNLDENGNVIILPEDIATPSGNCGEVTFSIDVETVSCNLGDYDVTITATDVDGRTATCVATVTVIGADADCDTVADACDLCPGGDDNVDNNMDGDPDCAFPPDNDDILDAWRCAPAKVYICHIPPGNPENAHTICVSDNSINAHLEHGDYLGPCEQVSCDEAGFRSVGTKTKKVNQMALFPNPVQHNLNLLLDVDASETTVSIKNQFGQIVYESVVDGGEQNLRIDISGHKFSNGVYFVTVRNDGTQLAKKFIVHK